MDKKAVEELITRARIDQSYRKPIDLAELKSLSNRQLVAMRAALMQQAEDLYGSDFADAGMTAAAVLLQSEAAILNAIVHERIARVKYQVVSMKAVLNQLEQEAVEGEREIDPDRDGYPIKLTLWVKGDDERNAAEEVAGWVHTNAEGPPVQAYIVHNLDRLDEKGPGPA